MAKCWLATWTRRAGNVGLPSVDSFHATKCSYCDEPRDFLIQMLEEFRDWSFISTDLTDDQPLRLEIEQFLAMPTAEQLRLVEKAQGKISAPSEVVSKVSNWWSET